MCWRPVRKHRPFFIEPRWALDIVPMWRIKGWSGVCPRGVAQMLEWVLSAALAMPPAVQATVVDASVPSPERVMALPEGVRDSFRREVIEATRFPEARLGRLIKFVFDKDGLGIAYKADATLTIAEAVEARTANCLTSTMLVVALAREAGLDARGQLVEDVPVWGAEGELVVQSRHANAIVDVGGRRRFVVDVDASGSEATDALHPVEDAQLLASYYGNRAAELMLEGRYQAARTWSEIAIKHSPGDVTLWNNAGVLSLRMGRPGEAEDWFLKAVRLAPDQTSALSNLVDFYRRQGDAKRMREWQARSQRVLRRAPYYQYQLGRQSEVAGKAEEAARHYRQAIRLARGEHRFHFALARTYFAMGYPDRAGRELVRAHALTDGALRARYEGKLATLRNMRRGAGSPPRD